MKPRTIGFLLGLLLGAFAWLGNLQRADTLTISVFPDFLTPLAVPILLYLALRWWDRRHPNQDVKGLRRAGWGMVHAQAAVFALFIAVLAAERTQGDVTIVASVFTTALVITAGVGYVSVEVWTRLLVAVRARAI
jgi:hypothetical protein